MIFEYTAEFAKTLDQRNELGALRDEFILPQHGEAMLSIFSGIRLVFNQSAQRAMSCRCWISGRTLVWKAFSEVINHGWSITINYFLLFANL